MRIGVAQLRSFDTVEENAANILRSIEEARRLGVRILGFPETALSGYLFEGFPRVDPARLAAALDQVAARAREAHLAVVLGTVTREDGKLRNSAAVLLPDGGRHLYHKINLVPYEQGWFAPGDTPVTFEVDGTRFGVMVCRDQNSPELSRALKQAGARGLFICSAHFYDLMEARMKLEKNVALPIVRAYENGVYLFKANAVGTNHGTVSYGNSMIVDPRGIVVQRAGETQEELLVYDVDFTRDNPRWGP
jgi:predicted amidohydrolase